MVNILVVDSDNGGGVGYWRNLRPMTQIQRDYANLNVQFGTYKVPASQLMATDVLVMFRPVTAEALNFIRTCKEMFGIKIVLDIDDNLWRLPPGHPMELQYNEVAGITRQIYALADVIWCSTEPLMDYADARDGRGVIVKNAVMESDLPIKPARYDGGVVLWRGDMGQIADITDPDAIAAFEGSYDKYRKWAFWGYWPAAYRREKCQGIARVDVMQYIKSLPNVGANVMWKPLQENEFNDAKSNIAWIEATIAGGVCVTNYAQQPGWEWALDDFPDNADFIESQWKGSRWAILNHYNLREENRKRVNSIVACL